jgi:TolB-like protein
MSFLREIQRRNVGRVATAYIVAAWLIVQVADTILLNFNVPERVFQIVVIVLAIGFVPSVVLAWLFEWTPDGLKRDTEAELPAETKLARARRFDRGIIVVLLLAVSYFAVDKFVFTDPGIDGGFYGTHSIAVMPFDTHSSDAEQQHFVDGVTDEIRHLLGTIRDLRVIAELSSTLFRQNGLGVAEIRDEFKIGYLLAGSVRMAGSRVRVTARLIETKNETQLWSNVYEREVDDVFRIQDDIARNILHNLEIELQDSLPQSRNVNPEARALTQQVSEIFQVRPANFGARSYSLAKRALELDPNYPEAVKWMTYSEWMRAYEGLITWDEANATLRELEARYRELAPDSGYLDASKGFDAERARDLETAAELYLSALEKELTESEQLRLAGRFALLLGKIDVGTRILELCVAIDPLNHQCRRILAQAYMYRGNPGDYRRAIDVREYYMAKATGGQPYYSILLMLTGEPDKVAEIWADRQSANSPQRLTYLAMADYAAGREDQASATLARLEAGLADYREHNEDPGMEPEYLYAIGKVAAWFGDADKAFASLMAYTELADYTARLEVHHPVWNKIVDDPRWREYREAIGMSQARLDAIEFDPWLPE